MDLEELEKILELMDANKLVEFEYEEEGKKIRLKREDGKVPVPMALPPAPVLPAVAAPAPIAPAASAPASASSALPPNCVEFTAPLVGTFYRAPRPDTDSFVNVGDEVSGEKVLCIIEAMKVFNEIPAEVSGRVVAILVDDDEPLEFGKPLFKIDTSN